MKWWQKFLDKERSPVYQYFLLRKIKEYRKKENPYTSTSSSLTVANVAWALGHQGTPATELFVRRLKNKDRNVRRTATKILGGIGFERAVEPLVKALGDPDQEVRVMSAISLGDIGDPRATEPLLELSRLDASRCVRMGALEAIGKLKDPVADPKFIKLLFKMLDRLCADTPVLEQPNSKTLILLVKAIGNFKYKPAIEVLCNLMDSRHELRLSAAKALQKIGLDNLSLDKRIHCLLILRRTDDLTHDKETVAELINALKNPDPDLRSNAIFLVKEAAKKGVEINLESVRKSLQELVENNSFPRTVYLSFQIEAQEILSDIVATIREGKQGMDKGKLSEGKSQRPAGSKRLVRIQRRCLNG